MPEPVLSPAGVKAVDARLEKAGLLDLAMEEAGRAGADAVQQFSPVGGVLLLAGGGANGGDPPGAGPPPPPPRRQALPPTALCSSKGSRST